MTSLLPCCESYLTTVLELTEITLKRHGVVLADEPTDSGLDHPDSGWLASGTLLGAAFCCVATRPKSNP